MGVFCDLKQADAIDDVIYKLKFYANLIKYGIEPALERVPSFTTSILSMPEGNGSGIFLGEKVTKATANEQYELLFVKKYTAIIESLNSLERDAIVNKYIKGYSYRQLKEGTRSIIGNKHIELYLKNAYVNIALLDEEVDYSIDDYLDYHKREASIKKLKQTNKKAALALLNQLRNKEDFKPLGFNLRKVEECIEEIPDTEREILKSYVFKDDEEKITTYQYQKIRRALLTFIFIYPDFKYSQNEYLEDMQKTGNGWKKCYQQVIKNENKEEKEITHD